MAYSSGMKMRLAFSIAIFSELQVLIVDEALSVGDAHFGAKCTRDLRVLLLNTGEVAKEGKPEDVVNSYNFFISKLNDTQNNMKIKSEHNNLFGTFDVEIIGENSKSNVMSSGENASIITAMSSKIDVDNMTMGIRIKDKSGQDIYGTNTHHHKKVLILKRIKNMYVFIKCL